MSGVYTILSIVPAYTPLDTRRAAVYRYIIIRLRTVRVGIYTHEAVRDSRRQIRARTHRVHHVVMFFLYCITFRCARVYNMINACTPMCATENIIISVGRSDGP